MELLTGSQNHITVPDVGAPGPLEAKLLLFIWRQEDPVTVQEVYRHFRENTDPDTEPRYTTFLNTMSAMAIKGLLTQDKIVDPGTRSYKYSPAVTHAELGDRTVKKVLAALRAAYPEALAKHLR